LLARVGLSEAWTYLRTPSELSEGQRWRFKLALALHRAGAMIVSQESARTSLLAAGGSPRGDAEPTGAPAHGYDWREVRESSPILACDEFAAVLDRVTAMVVARCLRLPM